MRTVEFKFDIGQQVEYVIGAMAAISVVVNACILTGSGVSLYGIRWLGPTKAVNSLCVYESELRKIPSKPNDETTDVQTPA